MSKFNYLKEEILEYYKENPNEGSDRIAAKFAVDKAEIGSLGRTIRRWLKEEPITLELSKPKVLIFDIETAPMICYAWHKYQDSIADNQIIQDWFIISWSAKWLFEDEMISMSVTSKEIKKANDKRVVEGLWKILDEADIVVAHNLRSFDKKKAQTRFLKHDLKLPSQYLEVDTLLTARREFKVSSNRLDYLAGFLGLEGKLKTEQGLWNRCMEGDKQALEDMVTYCEQDVRVLEDVYLALRPYMKNHPNLGLFVDSNVSVCKSCGSHDLKPEGVYRTTSNIYEALKCNDCGSQHRAKQPITPKVMSDRLNK